MSRSKYIRLSHPVQKLDMFEKLASRQRGRITAVCIDGKLEKCKQESSAVICRFH